jgi:hypothetical protein
MCCKGIKGKEYYMLNMTARNYERYLKMSLFKPGVKFDIKKNIAAEAASKEIIFHDIPLQNPR